MKVALVSFGHSDSAIPMTKALSVRLRIDLIFAFSLNMKKNNVMDFEHLDLKPGMQDNQICENAFSAEVKNYTEGKFKLGLFIYKNLKLKSLSNWILSWKFATTLRQYDIIHFNGKNLNIIQLRIFLPFKKFVFTIHDLENHTGEPAKNKLAQRFNHLLIKFKYHVVIQNKTDYNQLKHKYASNSGRIHFIPFGILEIYKQYDKEDNKLPFYDLLFFGRISPYKGIEYFIEAVKKLKVIFPEIKAVIAGSGKFYFDITNIENDPSFTIYNKFVQSEELVALIKSCRIVICPYIDSTQSGVAMTSFVFNKPVIATETGGFKDIVIDGLNGYLVPVKDSDEIFKKVKILLENPDLLEQMNKNIAKLGEEGEFSWNSIAIRYEELYKLALKVKTKK